MAKIYDFELKGVKQIENEGFTCGLYYKNKKIGVYTDINNENLPQLVFDKKITEEMIDGLLDEIKDYYNKYPKEFLYKNNNYLFVEFIEELYRLRELETIFKKTNKKEKNILIELRFSKRTEYISNFIKEDVCLTTTLWNEEFKSNLIEKYKPAEYSIYSSLEDFNIDK